MSFSTDPFTHMPTSSLALPPPHHSYSNLYAYATSPSPTLTFTHTQPPPHPRPLSPHLTPHRLCGYPPFEGDTPAELYDAIRACNPDYTGKEWDFVSAEGDLT